MYTMNEIQLSDSSRSAREAVKLSYRCVCDVEKVGCMYVSLLDPSLHLCILLKLKTTNNVR